MFRSPVPLASGFAKWMTPAESPRRREYGVGLQAKGSYGRRLTQTDLTEWPFCVLTEFATKSAHADTVLLVAPLSGHFSFILREMVVGLSPGARIGVTDWLNARYIPVSHGDFGFEDNVATIMQSLRRLGPDTHVVALCQSVVPALAAAAILAREEPEHAPRSLALIGGPVDPLANPTRVVELLRECPLRSLENSVLEPVGAAYPGAGRIVYPARRQLNMLMTYYYRHLSVRGEVYRKTIEDDGLDPVNFPFWDLFTSLMDLPATYFLENIRRVFLDRDICHGMLCYRGAPVDFRAIRNMPLMTIEGENDDIAAPGQTAAAHAICANIPEDRRRRLVIPGAGHFSLFHGRIFRNSILPEIRSFLGLRHPAKQAAAALH